MTGKPCSSAGAAAKPPTNPRLCSAAGTKGPNPSPPGNSANPDIPATLAAAKKLLVDCSLNNKIDTKGVVVLLHGALEALANSKKLSVDLAKCLIDYLDKSTNNLSMEVDSKLDQNAKRMAFLAGRVEHVAEKVKRVLDISIKTCGQVIALKDFASAQRDAAPPTPAPTHFGFFNAPEPDYGGFAPPPHMQPPLFMQAPPPTTYAQAVMAPPAPMPPSMIDLKEADTQVELQQREVLLKPIGDRDTLKRIADHQLLNCAVAALDKVRESITNWPSGPPQGG
ncbi:hypothetical protein FRC09_002342 [Ceratobasidium sp. 395]|nr:hypothetical protein FRC09_002342 [Ceratobasidium sp. 395]